MTTPASPAAPAVPPVRPPRPPVVTAAAWSQLAAAVLLLALAALAIWQAVRWNGEIDRAARLVPDADPGEVDGERFGVVMTLVVVALPALLFAVALSATVRGVCRGSNVARIVVFVVGGIQALALLGQGCCAGMLLPLAFSVAEPTEDWGSEVPGDVPEDSRFIQALYDHPDRVGDVLLGLGLVIVVLVLALTVLAAVLLALPTAHRWFVPERPGDPHRRPPAGLPAAPPFLLPPGYMICPDPRAHGVPPQPAAPPAPADVAVPTPPGAPTRFDGPPPAAPGADPAVRPEPPTGDPTAPPADPPRFTGDGG